MNLQHAASSSVLGSSHRVLCCKQHWWIIHRLTSSLMAFQGVISSSLWFSSQRFQIMLLQGKEFLVKNGVFSEEWITTSASVFTSGDLDLTMETNKSVAHYNNADLLSVHQGDFLTFSSERHATSPLGPLVNALELLYSSPGPMSLGTYEPDGLEYLHKGCKPPIIHRDVKCGNILLDEGLEGKISDFGISRVKLTDTHMTVTNVQGTVGYIATEYAELWITEKIDIFAFGVVLLEVVSGKRPFEGSEHTVNWVRPLLNQSQIQNIADPRIENDYNTSSMWKVLEVAMACVEQDAQRRLGMHEVSVELHAALSLELQNDTIMRTSNSSHPSFEIEDVLAR